VFWQLVPDCALEVVVLSCERWILSWVAGGISRLSACACWDAGAESCLRVPLPWSVAWLLLLDWLYVKLEFDDIVRSFLDWGALGRYL
jgi:hypothetical protein